MFSATFQGRVATVLSHVDWWTMSSIWRSYGLMFRTESWGFGWCSMQHSVLYITLGGQQDSQHIKHGKIKVSDPAYKSNVHS